MITQKPHNVNNCYIGPLKDGEITLIESSVTTKHSILLSKVADIQNGIEFQSAIEALIDYNLVWVPMKSMDLDMYLSWAT
jgi:hypothetical protein